jgi:hypothetical protein
MVVIIFNDNNNIPQYYNSFKEILKLDNYNDIIYIDYSCDKLSSLPKLPNSLQRLHCEYNNLSILPELPNSLTELYCHYNNLSSLPELPNSLIQLYCDHNMLSSLPELPHSLTHTSCNCNNLSSLPQIPNSLTHFNYYCSPIFYYIKDYFNGKHQQYFEHQKKIQKIFINKIGDWYLDCKYNPKYLYCRNRLMKEYEELYT